MININKSIILKYYMKGINIIDLYIYVLVRKCDLFIVVVESRKYC